MTDGDAPTTGPKEQKVVLDALDTAIETTADQVEISAA